MAKAGAVAERYAQALFALAGEKGLEDAVAKDLAELARMAEQSADLQSLIYSPILKREEQVAAITALAQKAQFTDMTLRFLGALARSRRLPALAEITETYGEMLARKRGEHVAEVTSAAPLRPGQIESLREKLAAKLGGSIRLNLRTDPEILGGLVVKIGSRMIDTSLRGKLERIGFLMKGSV